MSRLRLGFAAAGTLLGLLLQASPMQAQTLRTWVSGLGDDSNPCSLMEPCRTFAGAISKTAAGGEINVLGSAGFGGVTITKSITISSERFDAGVLASGTNGIVISAAATDVVILRGLNIEGLGTGLVGIKVLGGLATLRVERCTIKNFRGTNSVGIDIAPTTAGPMQLFIEDTIVRRNGQGANGGGIFVHPGAGVTVKGSLENVRLEFNVGFGIRAQDRSTLSARSSVVSGNSAGGVVALATGGAAVNVMLDNVMVSNNGTDGVAAGASATVRISNVIVTGNATGLNAAGGEIVSAQNNFINGNTTDGAPTSTPGQQ